MGRLLIFAGVILVVVGLLVLWGFLLKNRENAEKAGLPDAKKRMDALKAENAQYREVLTEIRDLAESSEIVTSDPLWSMVIDKTDEVLNKEIEK